MPLLQPSSVPRSQSAPLSPEIKALQALSQFDTGQLKDSLRWALCELEMERKKNTAFRTRIGVLEDDFFRCSERLTTVEGQTKELRDTMTLYPELRECEGDAKPATEESQGNKCDTAKGIDIVRRNSSGSTAGEIMVPDEDVSKPCMKSEKICRPSFGGSPDSRGNSPRRRNIDCTITSDRRQRTPRSIAAPAGADANPLLKDKEGVVVADEDVSKPPIVKSEKVCRPSFGGPLAESGSRTTPRRHHLGKYTRVPVGDEDVAKLGVKNEKVYRPAFSGMPDSPPNSPPRRNIDCTMTSDRRPRTPRRIPVPTEADANALAKDASANPKDASAILKDKDKEGESNSIEAAADALDHSVATWFGRLVGNVKSALEKNVEEPTRQLLAGRESPEKIRKPTSLDPQVLPSVKDQAADSGWRLRTATSTPSSSNAWRDSSHTPVGESRSVFSPTNSGIQSSPSSTPKYTVERSPPARSATERFLSAASRDRVARAT
eukprot:GEMP01010695.1.p1 GENE.GEMP01010695.1~~GEMP01010695.1.p1  ORF type:complete len:540 (+),score=127.33 GEMP01010695.1:149-1621(+)